MFYLSVGTLSIMLSDTSNNNLSLSVAKQALLKDVHWRGANALCFILLPVSWLTAEALSLNPGPIAKLVVRIRPLDPK